MELLLISASSTAGEPADCTLTYRLDDETSPHGLPVVNQTYPWAGKAICALRDRLMIEWVLSFPESKRLFDKIVDEITTAIQKRPSSGSKSSVKPTVRVGVVCSNGAQLSPSFVEKLYDHFSYSAKGMEGLKVSRYHQDATRGTWGRSKDLVWEVSCIPVRRKIHFREVFKSKMWLSFDPTANSESERQFRKNPLLSRLEFTDMVLDFESGTAYSSQRRETYYIRCSHISQSKTNCWILTNAGYTSACQSFHAAGIQPYSVHPVTGEAVFLLGKITYGLSDWCDFGGLKSSRWFRGEHPRLTAARECAEETLEILGTSAELAAALKDYKTNNCFKIFNGDTQYVEHFLRIPYRDYSTIFEGVLKEKEDCVIEVDKMKWFSLSSMKAAVKMAHANPQQLRIRVNALKQDGTVDESRGHPLRKPFVGTLCIADALNILDSIAAIARSIHRKQTPSGTTLPYVCTPEPREMESEAVASSSCGQSSSDSPTTLEQLVSHVDLDQSSDSNSETEDEDSGNHDTSSNDGPNGSNGHAMGSSNSDDHNTESSELSESDKLSSNIEVGPDLEDSEPQDKESSLSPVKGKIVNLTSGRKKRRKRADSRQGAKYKGRHTTDSRSETHSFKRGKRKRKQFFLYGMGAGSFPIGEMYMNS